MIKYENGCVDCSLPCLGSFCPLYNEKHYYCDECGEDCDTLYYSDNGEELCNTCILDTLEKVK